MSIGIVVFGLIGLAAGCFIVFLVNPGHPIVKKLVYAIHGKPAAEPKITAPSKNTITPNCPVKNDLVASRVVQWEKKSAEHFSKPGPTAPKPVLVKRDPVQKLVAPKNHNSKKTVAPPAKKEIEQAITLNLSKRLLRVELPKGANSDDAEIRVDRVIDLGATYELQPNSGILRLDQSVDVLFSEYPGIRIHLDLQERGKICLEVAPQIDLGQGVHAELTRRRVKQLCMSTTKEAQALNQQMESARTAAQNIKLWLMAPSAKLLQVRGEKKRQLLILTKQTIPALKSEIKALQDRMALLQQLVMLVKQIHGKANIVIVIAYQNNEPEKAKMARN